MSARRTRRFDRPGPTSQSVAVLTALLVAFVPASAQESDVSAPPPTGSADPTDRAALGLERGGVAGFEALSALAAELDERIRQDTRALVEARGGPLASVADVTLRMRLDPGRVAADSAPRLESLRLEMGRVVSLDSAGLRALERGDDVTAYAGTLPAALGVVRIRAEGSSGSASRSLDRALRLAIAPGQRVVVRVEIVEEPETGWRLNPVLERVDSAENPVAEEPSSGAPAGDPAPPVEGRRASSAVPPALLTAFEEVGAGHYVLALDRLRSRLDERSVSADDRAAALWLRAAASARTGRSDEFGAMLEELRRSSPRSPYRHLAEIERLMALDDSAGGASPIELPAPADAPILGIGGVAALLGAASEGDSPPAAGARIYGEAASMGGPLGALASYRAGGLWRRAGRPDSAAFAFERARSAGGALGGLALVGQAEARLAGGDAEGALNLLDRGAPEASTPGSDDAVPVRVDVILRGATDDEVEYAASVASEKVRARALARLGRLQEAREALRTLRDSARTVGGRAEAEILLADLVLTTGDPAEARALFAEARRALDRALASADRGAAPSSDAGPDREGRAVPAASRPVVDLGSLVHRWSDRATRTLVTRDGARDGEIPGLDAGTGYGARDSRAARLSMLWSMPEAPAAEEARVRSALWLLVDAQLETLRSDLLGTARGWTAVRALERLGEEPDRRTLREADDRAERLLGTLLGPTATEVGRTFRARAAALEAVLSANREIRSALDHGSPPAAGPDALLVATRPEEVLRELRDTRSRNRDLLDVSRRLIELEMELADSDEPVERGRKALELARRLRQIRSRLDSTGPAASGNVADRAGPVAGAAAEDWSRTVTDLVGRAEAALLAAPADETAEAIRKIHETEWRVRAGEIDRSRAVELLLQEVGSVEERIRRDRNRAASRERAARAELRRALEARRRAVDESPTSPERTARRRLAAALEIARFGEASASFFAALDAPDDESRSALREAVRLHRTFAEEHPESPLRTTALLQLAELEARSAETRFAARLRDGDVGRDSGDTAGIGYEAAISSLERTLSEAEGEERSAALQSLGYLLFQQGRYEDAADRLAAYAAELEADDPRMAEALFRQADAVFAAAMERSGRERAAELADAGELYRRTTRASTPGSELEILALYKLGWSRYLLDEYQGAADAFGTLLDRYAGFADRTRRPLDLTDEVTEYAAVSLSQLPSPVDQTARFARARPPEYEYPVYRKLARSLAEQGRLPDAVAALEAYRSRRPLDASALEAQLDQLRLYESERADSARAQDIRLELALRFGPDSEWWNANPEARDSAAVAVGRALRRAAHYRMRQAGERDDRSLYLQAGELYLRYVETLPANDSIRTMRYMAGEAFFEADEFLRAGDAYRAAAYDGPGDLRRRKEAGLNAIAAYQQVQTDDTAAPQDAAEAATRLYDAVDRFVDAFPDAEETPRTLRTRAEIAFRRDDLEVARDSYRTLLDRFPDSDYAPRARKLLGDLAYRAGEHDRAFSLWQEAESAARSSDQADLAGELSGLRAEATLTLADSLADAGDLERSADRYLQFARGHPDDERAPDAYVNAADVLVEAHRPGRAVDVLSELLDGHPGYDGAFDAAVQRAELLVELGRDHDAIDTYAGIHDAFGEHVDRGDVLLRMAELQEEVGDRTAAAESWILFQRSHPDDARSPDALLSAARILEEAERERNAEQLYARFVEVYAGHGRALEAAAARFRLQRAAAPDSADDARRSLLQTAADAPAEAREPHRRLIGLAHVEVAEELFDAFLDLRFAPSELTEAALRSARERMDRSLEEIVRHLEAAVGTGAAEPVSRGLDLLGDAYAAYADDLRDVELPEGTGAEVRRAVEERTEEVALRYDDRAREPWTRLVELGRQKPDEMDLDASRPGVQNRWIDRAEEKLNRDGRTR